MDANAPSDMPVASSPADRPIAAAGALAALGIVYGDLGGLIFLVMRTWRRGINAIHRSAAQNPETIAAFLIRLRSGEIARVPGTAVFLSGAEAAIPAVMVRHVAQIKALQEKLISLTVRFEEYPRVPLRHRAEVDDIAENFWHITNPVRFCGKAKHRCRSCLRTGEGLWH